MWEGFLFDQNSWGGLRVGTPRPTPTSTVGCPTKSCKRNHRPAANGAVVSGPPLLLTRPINSLQGRELGLLSS